jgi:hypothetical protein
MGWDMTLDHSVLAALLDSWDRNNRILVNLLRTVPEGGLEVRAMQGSPSVAEMFTHIHYVRLVFVAEGAPEFARELPNEEWVAERDPARIAQMLDESAKTVRDAVKGRLEAGGGLNHSLRPSDPVAPAHDLARRVPSRSDETRPQDVGPSHYR